MSRPPPGPGVLARLARLQALARIKADAEIARLASTAQSRARLIAALDALGTPEPPLGPAPVQATDTHGPDTHGPDVHGPDDHGPDVHGSDNRGSGGSGSGDHASDGNQAAAGAGRAAARASAAGSGSGSGAAPGLTSRQAADAGSGGTSARPAPSSSRSPPPSAAAPPPAAAPARVPDPPALVDPALIRARLAHAGWIAGQRRELNARLAMVQADWHRLRPAAARALGRAEVLKALHADLAARRRSGPG